MRWATFRGTRVGVAGLLFLLTLFCSSVQAVLYTWDPNGSTAPNPTDGDGTWTSSGATWWDGSSTTSWPGGGGQATFGIWPSSNSYTVTISGFTPTLTGGDAACMSFMDNYTIAGQGLTYAATDSRQLARVAVGTNVTISAPITFSYAGGTSVTGDINGKGTLNLTGGMTMYAAGSEPSFSGFRVGSDTSTPTVNFLSGTYAGLGSNYKGISIAPSAGSNGTLNIKNASAVNFSGSGFELIVSNGGTAVCSVQDSASVNFSLITVAGNNNGAGSGTLNLGGGTTTGDTVNFGRSTGSNASTGTINLTGDVFDAGTLVAGKIAEVGSNVNSTFNFDGGTLKPTGSNSSDFFNNTLDHAYVKNGGAFIDTNGHNITIAQPLLQYSGSNGGLTKQGGGILTLSGANTYTGTTAITSGTLALASAGTIANSSAINVSAGSTLDASAKSTWTIGSGQTLTGSGTVSVGTTLALNGHLAPGSNGVGTLGVTGNLSLDPSSVADVELGSPGTSHGSTGSSDRTTVSSSLAINGTLNLSNAGGAGPGSYKIFSYGSGSFAGSFGTVNNGVSNTHAKLIDGGSADRSIYVDLYGLANADTSASNVTLDVTHVGDAFAAKSFAISNTAGTPASFTEGLSGTVTPSGTTVSGTISNVAAGSNASLSVGLTASTATAGHKIGSLSVALVSDKTNSGWSSDTSLGTKTVNVAGDVNYYAQPTLAMESGVGSFSGAGTHYSLDLGDVELNSGEVTSVLQILNASLDPVYQDLLGGTFDTSGISQFMLVNFESFNGVASGFAKSGNPTISFDTTAQSPGLYTETLYFSPSSTNTSGSWSLDTIQLDITANVVPEPGTLILLAIGFVGLLVWRVFRLATSTKLIGVFTIAVFVGSGLTAWADHIPVFIVAGQSNAVGYATDTNEISSSLLTPQSNVLYAGSQLLAVNWAALQAPTETDTSRVPSGRGFGPELMLGKTISDAWGGQEVGIVKFAMNASSLCVDWNPNTPGSYYFQMLDRVNDALAQLPSQHPGTTGYVAGFFWMQGERDSNVYQRTTEEYQTDLTNFIGALRTAFGNEDLPFVFGLINNAGAGTAAVRQAQINVAATVLNTCLVDTDSYERVTPTDIHFNSVGMVSLGTGFGEGYLSVVPEPGCFVLLLCGVAGSFVWRRGRANF